MPINVNNLSVEIFTPDIEPIAQLERRTAIRWTDKFFSCGDFEIWCPITELNSSLLQKDNLVWLGGDTAGIIEYVEKTREEGSAFSYHVKGRFLDSFFDGRCIYPQYSGTSKTACQHISDIIYKYCINPEDTNRKMSKIISAEVPNGGDNISYQQTGEDILSEIEKLAEANSVGFSLNFDPKNKQFIFYTVYPKNRSWSQIENDPVVFDSASDDILESTYTANWADGKNVAYVAGEGEGNQRKLLVVTNAATMPIGTDRKELWVDARDLSSQKEDGSYLTNAQYEDLLHQRGLQRLAEYQYIESFSSVIKTFGFEQNVLGVDFFLGDFVTIVDRELGLSMDTQITEVEQTWDEKGYRIEITFGKPQPKILDVVKRMEG